jgi:hypothetical protein
VQPPIVFMLTVGGLLSLYLLWHGVSELRQRIAVEGPSAMWRPSSRSAVFMIAFFGGFLLVFSALGRWWPEAQIPFMAIWIGVCVLVFLWLVVRGRRGDHS